MNARMEKTAPALLALALTCLCYGYSLNTPLVWDDKDVITPLGVALTSRDIPSYFATGHWQILEEAGPRPYRPLRDSYLAVVSDLSRGSPWLFHAGNLLLQSANVLLVYLLCRRLLRDMHAACLAAVVFAVHPIHGEVVAWAKNAAELLACLMGISAFLFFMRACDEPRFNTRCRALLAASFALYPLALLCKESVLALPALMALWAALWLGGRVRRRMLLATLPLWAVGLLYAGLQYAFLSSSATKPTYATAIALAGRLMLCAETIGAYARAVLLPIRHEPLPYFAAMSSATGAQSLLLLLFFAALAGLLAVHVWRRRQRAFGLWWALLALAPVANFVKFNSGRPIAEQRAYLPSIGFVLLLGAVVAAQTGRARVVATGAIIMAICAFAALSFSAGPHWQSNLEFWRWTTRTNPGTHVSCHNIALMYTQEARTNATGAAGGLDRMAQAMFLKTLQRDSTTADFAYHAGCSYRLTGDFAAAIRFQQRAIALEPRHALAHFELACNYVQMGDKKKAIAELRIAAGIPGVQQGNARTMLAQLGASP
jgi:protein O-mannosyl-transferase